jgi:PAS domain S-box-containing protein
MLSPEGIVTSWNAGARRIKGYSASEILGRHFSCFYSDEDIESGKPWSEIAVAKEHGRAEDEGWRVRKDGSRFWARVVVTALHDGDGSLRGFAKVTQDMTQRRHSNALEVSAANVNDFIAVLAHELRNPLAPIRNAVHLQKIATGNESVLQTTRQIIERQSWQLSRIVDDLLDISRITRGVMTIKGERVNLSTVVSRAVETARPAIEAGAHKIELDLADTPLHVLGDALRLDQVMSNLLNNAARYSEPGGKIVIKTRPAARDGHPFASISIRDSGNGIDPGMLDAIFGMFIQGKDPKNRPAGGLGVGLALSRAIVELHHGTLSAQSEGLRKGAEFTILLPLLDSVARSDEAVQPVDAIAAEVSKQGLGRRVMVVDDNIDAALVLASILRQHGYEAMTVHDGATAITESESFRPDVVLLDIGMPGMSGLEVARRLRERNRTPRPLLVAVTGWGKPEDAIQSRDAGIDVHMVKPVEERELLQVLQQAG